MIEVVDLRRGKNGPAARSLFRRDRRSRPPTSLVGELLDLGPAQSAFGPDGRLVVDVPERDIQVLVVRRGDVLFASRANCPHLGWRLDDAVVRAGGITCRGHGICFDLRTGFPKTGNRRVPPLSQNRLEVYLAWIENGTLRVLLPPR